MLSRLAALATVLVYAIALACTVGCQNAETATPGSSGASKSAASEKQAASEPSTSKTPEAVPAGDAAAKAVLDQMVAAYKGCKSYFDQAKLNIRGTEQGQPADQSVEVAVALVKPNKLRVNVYRGTAVCDGRQFWAFAQHLPNQVLNRPAPSRITIKELYSDEILMDAMSQGPTMSVSWVPVQLLLLLADNPLKTLMHGAKETLLLDPQAIGDRECDRVKLVRPDGFAVLWIDRQSHILRRLELPLDEINRDAKQSNAEVHSIIADFTDAQFDAPIGESTFQFEMPKGVETVDFLQMPSRLLLGKPSPDFAFTGLDGKKIDPKSLAGKIAVIDFWATTCDPCRIGLPILDKVARKYKDNDKVAFAAVSVDRKETADKELQAMFGELGVSLPIARDPDEDAGRKLFLVAIPSMFILGPNGVVQEFEEGVQQEADLVKKIDTLLTGKDLFSQPKPLIADRRKQHVTDLEKWIADDLFIQPGAEMPEVKIAPKSEAKNLKLTPLWKSPDLKAPGQVLIVPQTNGAPKVLVLENVKSIVEVGPDGKSIALHPLDIGKADPITGLRTAVDSSGKRYYVGFAPGYRLYVFDENWKAMMQYPQGDENVQTPIADAQIADINGDGKLEVVVGYLGAKGVQCLSLDGKELWTNRSITEASRVAVLDPDAMGKRAILCTSALGLLASLDSNGKPLGEISVPNRRINWVAAEDLSGDKMVELCAMHFAEPFAEVAVGIGPKGEELWSYPLPKGLFERPVELAVPGNLGGGQGVWLLPGCDGSIHILAADGKPIEQFNYGASLTGLATTTINGKPALLVATKDSLEAWQVEKR